MYLIQVFLPLFDNNKQAFDKLMYDAVRDELKNKFGGVTFYRNAPAEGLWNNNGETNYDELVTAEVMVDAFDKAWWQTYKQQLEKIFRQDEILIRTISFEKI